MNDHIIFVCTSNTCRSPMAEYLARKWLCEHDFNNVTVASRSLTTAYEPENSPASPQGVEVMQTIYSEDMHSHRSKLLSAEDVSRASLIIGVTRHHHQSIEQRFQTKVGQVMHFPHDVEDPWHQPVEVFGQCAKQLEQQIDIVFTNRYK